MTEYPINHGIPAAPLEGRPAAPDFCMRTLAEFARDDAPPVELSSRHGQPCWFAIAPGRFWEMWVQVTPWLQASGNAAFELRFCQKLHGKPFYEITIGASFNETAFFARALAGLIFPGENLRSLMNRPGRSNERMSADDFKSEKARARHE